MGDGSRKSDKEIEREREGGRVMRRGMNSGRGERNGKQERLAEGLIQAC